MFVQIPISKNAKIKMKRTKTAEVIKSLEVVSDRETAFTSKAFRDFVEFKKIMC